MGRMARSRASGWRSRAHAATRRSAPSARGETTATGLPGSARLDPAEGFLDPRLDLVRVGKDAVSGDADAEGAASASLGFLQDERLRFQVPLRRNRLLAIPSDICGRGQSEHDQGNHRSALRTSVRRSAPTLKRHPGHGPYGIRARHVCCTQQSRISVHGGAIHAGWVVRRRHQTPFTPPRPLGYTGLR